MIKTGVSNWFTNRVSKDLKGPSGIFPSPANIPRWAAHLFLTTTINIANAQQKRLTVGQQISSQSSEEIIKMARVEDVTWTVPNDHFYALELLDSGGLGLMVCDRSIFAVLDTPLFASLLSYCSFNCI
jgi:hypothetical protein